VDLRRLRIGEWICGVSGVALLAVMFIDWYEAGDAGANAWEAFSVGDVFLAVLAVMAVGAALLAAAHSTPATSLALASLTLLVGLVAIVYVVLRSLSTPDVGGADSDIALGGWLGIVLTLLVNGGALASMRDERFPRAARHDVQVETLPPPEGGKA
jgi:membrane protein implicated in regulation of membrane protease activity